MAGIYIHIPFCLSKCVYCGFYSVANLSQKEAYLHALSEEISLRKDYLNHEAIRTVYFGGGTPSLLSSDEISHILHLLDEAYDLSAVEEITLEANPEQLSLDYCRKIYDIGIHRLSIGTQSFQDSVLRFMGRRHSAQEALNAVGNSATAGFTNISIDLIYGVSERTDDQWKEDIQTALTLPIQHLSCYALTPEENSILYRQIALHRHSPIDDEQATRQYQQLLSLLSDTSFLHYEVSNFATSGFESKHNSSYWDHTPYLGLGPAAHSFNGHSRQWNPSNIRQYAQNIYDGILYEEQERLSSTDLYNEHILLGLRTHKGLDLGIMSKQYGEARIEQLRQYFQDKVKNDYYEQKENRLRLTEAGLWFADGIAADAFI